MITIKKRYKFTSATGANVAYTLTANNTCVQISPASGTVASGTTVEFNLVFANIDCFDTVFTVSCIDQDCGVETTDQFIVNSPCSTLDPTISFTPDSHNEFKFTVAITGGTSPYNINWSFDDAIFTSAKETGFSSLPLQLKTTPPGSTEITVSVTDANGCSASRLYVHTFCAPIIISDSVILECIPPSKDGFNQSGTLILTDTSSCTSQVDWTTLRLSYDTENLNIRNTDGTLQILGKSAIAESNSTVTGTVANTNGIEGSFSFVVIQPVCGSVQVPTVLADDLVLNPDAGSGDTVFIPLKTFNTTTETIDFNTFTFVAGTGQTLVDAYNLTGVNGSGEYLPGEKQIKYTIGTKTENVEMLQYQFDALTGKKTNIAKSYIDFENFSVPTATANALTLEAGETATLDISSNDSGDIDFSTYEITSVPSFATVVNNKNGTVTITAPSTFEGTDTFDYKFTSTNGIDSAEATVTLTVQRAGGYTGVNKICKITVDLTTFLSGDVTSGGTWTADASNPSSPSIVTPTAVDFSSANAGNYKFTYTIGSSIQNVDINVPNYGLTITSTSSVVTVPSTVDPYLYINFATVEVESINNIIAEIDFNSGVNVDTVLPDVWGQNLQTGQFKINLDQGTGTYDITLKATDACGVEQTATLATITI